MFSGGTSFFVIHACKDGALIFRPARGSPAGVLDFFMTTEVYIKIERVRT